MGCRGCGHRGPDHRGSGWDLAITVALALVLMIALTRFVAQPFSIPSESMEPTLNVGDRVLVNKLAFRFREVQRGDVIVFDGRDSFVPASADVGPTSPFGALGAAIGIGDSAGTDFVKRVIGIGGDRVTCCDADGRVLVNGTPLEESGYLFPGDAPSQEAFDVKVPQGMLWVMGDHRSESADSRAHLGDPGGGMVSERRVIGRAAFVLFPPSRLGAIRIPESLESIGAS